MQTRTHNPFTTIHTKAACAVPLAYSMTSDETFNKDDNHHDHGDGAQVAEQIEQYRCTPATKFSTSKMIAAISKASRPLTGNEAPGMLSTWLETAAAPKVRGSLCRTAGIHNGKSYTHDQHCSSQYDENMNDEFQDGFHACISFFSACLMEQSRAKGCRI